MATKAAICAVMTVEFPHSRYLIEQVGNGCATISPPVWADELRFGGTVSGSVQMTVAVGEVALYSEGNTEMVAQAVGIYSIPQAGKA